MVQPPDADAAAGVGLCLVLQGGLEVSFGPVPLGLPVQLELVPVGIAEQVGRADAEIAVLPADAESGRLDGGDPPGQRVLAGRARRKLYGADGGSRADGPRRGNYFNMLDRFRWRLV